jgi:tetratricopeptide (TPR) repeat protein
MIRSIFLSLLSIIFILNFNNVSAKNTYFESGKKLYDDKNYNDSKFFFEKDIVFNPKSENSYLYLAKIFKEEEKDDLEENNLNTVLLLNPKNEEAIYLLALLSIKKSNFTKASELIATLTSVCEKFCGARVELQEKLDNSAKSE